MRKSDRMKVRVLGTAVVALLAAGIAGCATTHSSSGGKAAEAKTPLPGKPACISLYQVREDSEWKVLSSDELILYVQTYSNAYLIKLLIPVPGLNFDLNMGFRSGAHQGQICDGDLDQLIVPGRIPPGPVPIAAVRQLTVAQADALLKQHGLPLPPSQTGGK
jgi:Family of unknown function (DUF6491)